MEKWYHFRSGERALFIRLWLGCLLGAMAILPYALSLRPEGSDLGPMVVFATLLNSLLLYPLPIFLGIIAKRSGVLAGVPYLEGRQKVQTKSLLTFGILLGLLTGVLVVLGDQAFGLLGVDLAHLEQKRPGLIAGMLAGLYGGIVEEVLMRFFLMGLLVLFLQRWGDAGIWISIFGAALLFGIGHLPTMSLALGLDSIADLSGLMVTRVLVLNGIAGIICGWLYWKKGLEHAIVAHFSADMVLHVVWPAISKI